MIRRIGKGGLMFIVRLGLVAALATLSSCCKPLQSESLPVALRPQETNMWCWAASGEMTAEYVAGGNVQQCAEANRRFSRTDCCNSPTPAACVLGGWPDQLYTAAGLKWDRTTDAALSLPTLKRQISQRRYCSKKPFAFSWHWTNGGGHMMVARGFQTIAIPELKLEFVTLPAVSFDMVESNNPWPPNVGTHEWITYSNYVSGSDHTHWNDYYNIR
jgi:hypothetical protein